MRRTLPIGTTRTTRKIAEAPTISRSPEPGNVREFAARVDRAPTVTYGPLGEPSTCTVMPHPKGDTRGHDRPVPGPRRDALPPPARPRIRDRRGRARPGRVP